MPITFESSGSFDKTEKFLLKLSRGQMFKTLHKYGQEGVNALSRATPIDSGETATSWSYEVSSSGGGASITWTNSHMAGGAPVAIILQYGHGTGTGGYVAGRDYINPAMKPIFDKIANEVWKAVTTA